MEQEIKNLAKEFLMERIKAYAAGNPGKFVGTHVVKEWYPECLIVAKAVIEETNPVKSA